MNELITPTEYSDICPFSDSMFHSKMETLVKEPGFKHAVTWVMPDVDFDSFCGALLTLTNTDDFQKKVMYPFLEMLAKKTTEGISDNGTDNIDHHQSPRHRIGCFIPKLIIAAPQVADYRNSYWQ